VKDRVKRPHPRVAIENVDVVAGVEVIDSTLAVDLERVYQKDRVKEGSGS